MQSGPMASINDYNEKFWRAIISDRPQHASPKQIYYPKSKFSKKKALNSAQTLEIRHKQGEINLWQMKVQVLADQVLLRQLEGKQTILFSRLFREMMQQAQAELSKGSITTYNSQYNALIEKIGDFYPGDIKPELLNEWVNDCKFSTRKLRKSFLSRVLRYGEEHYSTPAVGLAIYSTKAERISYSEKDYKTFLVEAEVLQLARHMIDRPPHHSWKDPVLKAYLLLCLFYFPRRISDYTHMKPEWIEEHVVTIGDKTYKTKAQRNELVAPTPEGLQLLHLLKSQAAPHRPIFPFNPHGFYNSFKIVLDEVFPDRSKKISPHRLRDSGIMYLLYEKKLSPQEVMQITGHSDLNSLQRYMHRSGKALMEQKKKHFSVNVVLEQKKHFFQGIDLMKLTQNNE